MSADDASLNGAPFLSRLEHFISGDSVDGQFFVPRAEDDQQRQVLENLRIALRHFERAFGPQALENQLEVMLSAAQIARKRRAINARVLEARADINDRAAALREIGDEVSAREAEAEPTPDYEGRAEDDAWMREWCHHGI